MPHQWRKYIGMHTPGPDDAVVIVEQYQGPASIGSRELPLCLDLANHSPTGFAWGYQGSGPAQLALALMFDHMMLQTAGNARLAKERALDVYQEFKRRKVATWAWKYNWVTTTKDIEVVLSEIDKEKSR